VTADVEAGRYIVIHAPGFWGAVICAACRSRYNHVVISLGEGMIAEAVPSAGVRLAWLRDYAGRRAMINQGQVMTPGQRAAVATAARSRVGTLYNFPDLGDLGLEDLGIHWKWLLHYSGADKALICSQYAAEDGAAAGLDWLCGRGSACQVRPSDLARQPGMVPLVITGA
jgi:uncharacterized protein YycO